MLPKRSPSPPEQSEYPIVPGQVNPEILPQTDAWDFVCQKTGRTRNECKSVVYALLYGADVVQVMCNLCLEICDVMEIRMAFDEYTKQ